MVQLLLRVWIKVVDEWQISLGYVRGSKYLRAWIFRFTCLVFKTTCVDRRIPLREDAFFFMEIALSLLLDKRNMRAEAKGLRITSERYIVGLGVRCLITINRGQDSRQQAHLDLHHDPVRGCGTSPLRVTPSDVLLMPALSGQMRIFVLGRLLALRSLPFPANDT